MKTVTISTSNAGTQAILHVYYCIMKRFLIENGNNVDTNHTPPQGRFSFNSRGRTKNNHELFKNYSHFYTLFRIFRGSKVNGQLTGKQFHDQASPVPLFS